MDTETIARILANGYNRHIRDHGPDGSYAGEPVESRDGHGIVVERDGSRFAVRVERLPATAEGAPMSPGQCWAALKGWLEGTARAEFDVAENLKNAGTPESEASLRVQFALISAYSATLAKIQELERQT